MKTVKTIVVLCLMLSLLVIGCGKKEEVPMQMGNPSRRPRRIQSLREAGTGAPPRDLFSVLFSLEIPDLFSISAVSIFYLL